ncbi:MAG: DUF87 domain-containing protein [Pseudomonadota bacterium]
MNGLSALRAADFDWVMRLDDIWRDAVHDVPELNGALRNSILDRLTGLEEASPLGWVVLGPAGSGKTHLLGGLRQAALRFRAFFIMVDLTDVRDFFDTVLLGFLNSLREPEEAPQSRSLLAGLLRFLGQAAETAEANVARLAGMNLKSLIQNTAIIIEALARGNRNRAIEHQDVVRALVLLNSEGFDLNTLGYNWLLGLGLEQDEARRVNLKNNRRDPLRILRGLSWLMSLSAPTLLALDQLDALVGENRLASGPGGGGGDETNAERKAARGMIKNLGRGLSALPDYTSRTLCLVSCLEATWDILGRAVLQSTLDRYESPRWLFPFTGPELAARMIERRLASAFKASGIRPLYPTWPFAPKAFEDVAGLTPREVLRRCEAHRRKCLEGGFVFEALSLAAEEGAGPGQAGVVRFLKIDSSFAELKEKTPYQALASEKGEDHLGRLIQTACRLLLKETPLPRHIDLVVETRFGGGKINPPLHARVSLVHLTPGAEETHVCFRAVTRNNPNAFLARLKAALTASGIDRGVGFRRLFVFRAGPSPEGPKCLEAVSEFSRAGGHFINPTPADAAVMWALDAMDRNPPPEFEEWLQSRRPLSRLDFVSAAFPELFAPRASLFNPEEPDRPGLPPGEGRLLPLGRGVSSETAGLKVYLPLSALAGHVMILADRGAGKSVLVRRLVEEAALKGTSAVVVDAAAELTGLARSWPSPPRDWFENDPALAQAFRDKVEVVSWTPGVEAERPLYLSPWPDFRTIAPEALEDAVNLGLGGLASLTGLGASLLTRKKAAVLKAVLTFFARQGGGTFPDLLGLLDHPPAEALGQVRGGGGLAGEMATMLRAGLENNPLYTLGSFTDPRELFGPGTGPPRVSVLNLGGLLALEQRRAFGAGLASALFTLLGDVGRAAGWEGLTGIVALDEAKEFFPSTDNPACKTGLALIAALGKTRGLALIMAADSPLDLAPETVSWASTCFFGRSIVPSALKKNRRLLAGKGGRALNPARLDVGNFFIWSDKNITPPVLIETPMCLTYHPEEAV